MLYWTHGSPVAHVHGCHILVGHQNVDGWQLVLNYMQTPPTQYNPQCSGRAANMETHSYSQIERGKTGHAIDWRQLPNTLKNGCSIFLTMAL